MMKIYILSLSNTEKDLVNSAGSEIPAIDISGTTWKSSPCVKKWISQQSLNCNFNGINLKDVNCNKAHWLLSMIGISEDISINIGIASQCESI